MNRVPDQTIDLCYLAEEKLQIQTKRSHFPQRDLILQGNSKNYPGLQQRDQSMMLALGPTV